MFLFFISKSLNETTKYNSDLRSFARIKAFSNNKGSSKLFKQKTVISTKISIKLVGKYCKKLTQQYLFWYEEKNLY